MLRKTKIFILLIFLAFAMFLEGGCNKPVTDDPKLRVSVILPHSDDGYWSLIENSIRDRLEKAGENGIDIRFFVPQSNYNISEMTDLILRQVVAKVDVLVVQGVEEEGYVAALLKAFKQDIRVIFLDTDLVDFPSHLYIGTDNFAAGKLIGKELIKLNSGNGQVSLAIISGEPGYPNLEERIAGVKDEIQNCDQIKLVDILFDDYDAMTFIKRYYEARLADVLICVEGTGYQTLTKVFKERDTTYKHIIAFDINNEIQIVDGGVIQDCEGMGEKLIEELINYKKYGEYSKSKVITGVKYVSSTID